MKINTLEVMKHGQKQAKGECRIEYPKNNLSECCILSVFSHKIRNIMTAINKYVRIVKVL